MCILSVLFTADVMLFGALAKCPMCSGWLHYSTGMYRCSGYLSEWTKCSYSSHEPQRVKVKWKIPKATSNDYLLKWFKSQKVKKLERVLPPKSLGGPSGSHPASQSSRAENIAERFPLLDYLINQWWNGRTKLKKLQRRRKVKAIHSQEKALDNISGSWLGVCCKHVDKIFGRTWRENTSYSCNMHRQSFRLRESHKVLCLASRFWSEAHEM